MKFNKIVCVDRTKMLSGALEKLQDYSEEKVVVYNDYPSSKSEIINRIKDADAVLVSWHTQLGEDILEECPRLKYIGMACSLYDDKSANVAVEAARKKGIEVSGIFDYGDPGVPEFIVSEVVRLLHGFGKNQWKPMPVELAGRKVGIIGLGTVGRLLATVLQGFGVELFYYNRTRKPEWEAKGVNYLPLKKLLEVSEIVSLHLPKKTKLLGQEEFNSLGCGKILINTSLGLPFEEKAFLDWIKREDNFAIFDADGSKELSPKVKQLPWVICSEKSAGWSAETQRRLSDKVLKNLQDFLSSTAQPASLEV